MIDSSPDRLLVPREPRLRPGMLLGRRRWRGLPPPLDARPILHFFWARNAIYHGMRILEVPPGSRVMVPAFHCATAIAPIVAYGAEPEFYDVLPDCSIDLDAVRSGLERGARAVLAIHYFGFPQPLLELRELCDAHETPLVEDCAHVLTGRSEGVPQGATGDVGVFSWRKYLPVHDGGQLVVNRSRGEVRVRWARPGFAHRLRVAKDLAERLAGPADRGPRPRPGAVTGAAGEPRTRPAVNRNSVEFDLALVDLPASGSSRRIIERADVERIVARRRENYETLSAALEGVAGVRSLFAGLPPDTCPWAFPVRFESRAHPNEALRAAGVPSFAWDGVVHPNLPREAFPNAWGLFRHTAFLPLHQDIDSDGIDRVAAAVRRVARDAA